MGQEIADALVEYALPMLASVSSPPQLRAYLERASPEELITTWALVNREYLLQPLREASEPGSSTPSRTGE